MEHIKHIHSPDFTDPMFVFEEPKTKIRYLSLFSGIEAWSCAVRDMPEFEPVAFCEIEEFQSAVLKKHFPDVPNYGDIRNLDGRQFRGIVDLVVGGSPCQDWSCAGKRAGLEGDRSVLALEYIRILEEVCPRWIVFENVPGLLSCNSGADFQLLLQKMDELGYSCSWTILDSQYQFLAQRRRRVFLVGHTGADWLSPAKVLLEPESMCRNPPTRRKAGKDDSPCSENRSRNCGVSGTLCASGAGLDRPSASGNQLDYLVQDVYPIDYKSYHLDAGGRGCGLGKAGDPAYALRTDHPCAIAFAQNQRDEVRQMDVVGALAAEPGMKQTTYIAQVERERERERESNLQRDCGRSPLAGRQGNVEHDRRQTGSGGDVFGTLMAAEAQKCWLTNQNLGGDCWIMEKK